MSKSEQKKQYIPRFEGDWHSLVKTHLNNNRGHNKDCAIDSKCCSKEMANDIPDGMKPLCLWHRARMAQYYVMECGCKSNDTHCGDSIGRTMFRDYHNLRWEDMAVHLSCCGPCQNVNTETHMCGKMRVCPDHLKDHNPETLVEIEESDDSD